VRKLFRYFLPAPYRPSIWYPVAVFISFMIIGEMIDVFVLGLTIPSGRQSKDIAYFLAQVGAFFAPFAFLYACPRREPPLSVRPLLETGISYVLPLMLAQGVFAFAGGVGSSALLSGLYVFGLVVLIWGMESFLQSLGLLYDIRRLIILALMVLFMFDLVLFNSLIEEESHNRAATIEVLLAANPAAMVASAYGSDIVRGRVAYDRSVMQYYAFDYPSVFDVFVVLAAIGILFGVGGALLCIVSGKEPPEVKDYRSQLRETGRFRRPEYPRTGSDSDKG